MSPTTDTQIIAYCCQHCAYAAADLAGGLRLQYPPQIKIVQLPCTGKIDTLMVLEILENNPDHYSVKNIHKYRL